MPGLTREDPWLGRVLDRPVHALLPGAAADPGLGAELAGLTPGAFVFAKVPVAELAQVRLLAGRGFYLVDTTVSLARPFALPLPPMEEGELGFRWARPGDREAVAAISGEAVTFSRFHQDPALPRELADRVKAAWVGNFFTGGRGDALAVAVEEGQPVGFLLLLHQGRDLVIDLIATAPSRRRRGAARGLIALALAEGPRFERVLVGTQAANSPALALYQGLGFRVTGFSHVLHWHKPGRD